MINILCERQESKLPGISIVSRQSGLFKGMFKGSTLQADFVALKLQQILETLWQLPGPLVYLRPTWSKTRLELRIIEFGIRVN